ncbi:sigma factor [Dactylosporangium sp. NPDC000244]|uniref:sigma factor n=1 Tax=Dactylosporangium sp. NPDC000244 TaxID=3154365 RepID=UPI003321B917
MEAQDSFHAYVSGRLAALSRLAFLLCGDRHTAEDLVQVTLIRVAARRERVIAGGDPDPYVRRAMVNQHVSLWRRRWRLPGDVWRRGRRRRYQGRIAGAGTALLCLVGVAVLPGLGGGAQPAEGATAVIPASIERPYPWQATVDASPPGRASVLFGGDSLGLGSDPFETEGGKLAVVGRGGDYRTLRYPTGKQRAGLDVRLSPDGHLVAQSELHDGPAGWLVVTDLRTGRSRGYGNGPAACCYEVAAWRPDSGAVLVQHRVGEHSQLTLVDLASGTELPIDGAAPRDVDRFAWAAAFAPDGASFVAAFPTGGGTELRAFDANGQRRWSHDLGSRRLAGAGAYTADGSAIAVLTMTGCADDCDPAQLAGRRWTVSYLDAATGAERGGPAVTAAVVLIRRRVMRRRRAAAWA